MNDDFRDPLDDAIAHDLAPLAPDDIDADAALGALRPALQRARARRRLAVASSAFGAIVLVLGVGGLVAGSRTSHVNVQSPTTTLSPTSTPTTHKVRPTTTTTTHNPTSTTDGGHTSSTTPKTPVTPSTTKAGNSGASGPSGSSGGESTTTTAPEAKHTYTSTGGTLTITFAHGQITLDSYAAKPGYQSEVHTNKPDDIELRFTGAGHESRIRVRVQNGQLSKTVEEN